MENEITAVKNEVFDPKMMSGYEKLMVVCDRTPNLNGRAPSHNDDFCLIKDKRGGEHIEPTRSFTLKAVAIFGASYEPVGEPTVIKDGDSFYISRDVKVSLGDRYVIEVGACSTAETGASGSRAFHDAMARAMTRGLKRALEALIGLPFVNMMIKELFGTYSVPESGPVNRERQERNVTPDQSAKDRANNTYTMLKSAAEQGLITVAERNAFWNRILGSISNESQLAREVRVIEELIAERGGLQ